MFTEEHSVEIAKQMGATHCQKTQGGSLVFYRPSVIGRVCCAAGKESTVGGWAALRFVRQGEFFYTDDKWELLDRLHPDVREV